MIKDKKIILYGVYALTLVLLIVGVIGILLSYYNIQGLDRAAIIGISDPTYKYSELRSLMFISFAFAFVALIACIAYLLIDVSKSNKKFVNISKISLNVVTLIMFVLLVIWMSKFHSSIPTNSDEKFYTYSFQYFKAGQTELFMPIICLGILLVINICDNVLGFIAVFKKKSHDKNVSE